MNNDISWAYRFNGISAASVIDIDEINHKVYIDLIRDEKKLFVVIVILFTLATTIVKLN